MSLIDEIKERVKLQDVVAEDSKIRLKKSGANYVGFCPFHNDGNKPSFVVYVNDQRWKCFGACNESGDVIAYVQKKNAGWDTKQAVHELAKRAGIDVKGDDDLKSRAGMRLRESALKVAMGVFRKWLFEDKEALAYALDRGWTEETLKAAGIGFSGRATAEAREEMRKQFNLYGVEVDSPQAVMILGYQGDAKEWAKKQGLEENDFEGKYIFGFMNKPMLMYPHKFEGVTEYLTGRYLPGFDKEKKSHNPKSALAGGIRPYFNWLYKNHHASGDKKGKMLIIVEGQGDAITWGQWGYPAMALCGASWRYLVESGILDEIKNEYESFTFVADSDKTGDLVVTGIKNDFPLTTAFGPVLWVTNVPKKMWMRGKVKKTMKDSNDLAQWGRDKKIDKKWMNKIAMGVLGEAKPIVLLAAEYAGKQKGQFFEDTVNKLIRPMVVALPEKLRLNYMGEMAEALYPRLGKTERMTILNKWVRSDIKAARDEEDEGEFPVEQTLGGWYPDDETENSGYLIDIFYDKRAKRIRFAYAHIKDLAKNEREVGVANFLIIGNKKIEPPAYDPFVMDESIRLPSQLGELYKANELIKKNSEFYEKFYYMEDKSRFKFFGAWALSTWVYDSFDAINFLSFRGGSGGGKSDLAYLVGLTSYRFVVTLSISSNASYKGIAKTYKGTVLIDEVDDLMKNDDGTMRAFLKGRAFKRFANAMNMQEKHMPDGTIFVPSNTKIFGPAIMTGYQKFKDDGIENRCMPVYLSKTDSIILDKYGYEPGFYPPELEDEGQEIRNLMLRWRLETWKPKIELTTEQRKKHKLFDVRVSPRVNQVLRPMKVLSVMQGDMELLDLLMAVGRASYEDEMIKQASSFEAMILRAVLAAKIANDVNTGKKPEASQEYSERVKGYAEKVQVGKLGTHGTVPYILYKDVAEIVNEMMDAENAGGKEKKEGVKGVTIGTVCRESFRLNVERTGKGWVVILDKDKLDVAKIRYGLDREVEYQPEKEDVQAELGLAEEVNPL